MQNAGQYGPGAAGAHQSQHFVPAESSPNGGSTTSSLRQFRKKDVDKAQSEQGHKQVSEAHVARVAPQNHYPPASSDCYSYPTHQFSDYSPQVKYSDTAEHLQPNLMSASVIQKPKSKDYMEICNMQQPHMKPTYSNHIPNHQQFQHENSQYLHKDPTQIHPSGFKPEAHFFQKEQHQYQQLSTHPMQHKFNPIMAQNMRKYSTPTPSDNPFLNKLSKIHPSMARSIISDHHLQDTQGNYPAMDQRNLYSQQNHRYYPGPMYQQNQYSPNSTYPMNTPHYANYPSTPYNYPRNSQMSAMSARFHMERSMSPSRRAYPENIHMTHMACHNIGPKVTPPHNYPNQYGGPEYSQHYQHRRIPQDMFPPSCRPPQYIQNHHQIAGQEMQEISESRVSPSDSLKKFIENWAEEEPNNEAGSIEAGSLREKAREEAPSETVYMINANDVQYFENNGIPLVTTDSGGIQLTSENYQYLLKNGLIDNSGIVRIMEPNTNNERVVNLQIMESAKSDCMMVNKNSKITDIEIMQMPIKKEENNRKVVIHQNTVISSAKQVLPTQQNVDLHSVNKDLATGICVTKELVDKNCSPINLDHLNCNNDETDQSVLVTPSNTSDSYKTSSFETSDMLNSFNVKSPELKSMPIIDLFGESNLEHNKVPDEVEEENTKDKHGTSKNSANKCHKNDTSLTQSEITHNVSSSTDKDLIQSLTPEKLDAEKQTEISLDDLINNKLEDTEHCSTQHEICKNEGNREKLDDKNNSVGEDNNVKNSSLSVLVENTNISILKTNSEASEQLNLDIKTDHNEYNIDVAAEINLNQNTTSKPIGKRKRIFSVDDIIYNIGNNTKKVLNDGSVSCSTETLTDFINHEISYSSLEQLLIVDHKKYYLKKSADIATENTFNGLSKAISDDQINSPLTNADTEMHTCLSPKKENYGKLEQNDDKTLNSKSIDTVQDFSQKLNNEEDVNEEVKKSVLDSSCSDTMTADQIVANDDSTLFKEDVLQCYSNVNKDEQKSAKRIDTNDTLITNEDLDPTDPSKSPHNNQTQQEIEGIKKSLQSSNSNEIEEVTSPTNNVQYRKAISIEESSVLLEIAGELMEISINVVNGKKVITVLPISEDTVVDFNDNYECSSNIVNSQIDKSPISIIEQDFENSTEKVSTLEENLQLEDTTCDKNNSDIQEDLTITEDTLNIAVISKESLVDGYTIEDSIDKISKDLCIAESDSNNLSPRIIDSKHIDEIQDDDLEPKIEIMLTEESSSNIELLECPIDEGNILMSDCLSHEVVVSDPLEGIGLLDEVDASNNTNLILEPVTTTNIINDGSLDDKSQKNITENTSPVIEKDDECDNATVKTSSKEDRLNENCRSNNSKQDTRISKPEVLILSPTSTNLDDHFTNSKENIFLDIKLPSVDCETTECSSAITTKAAKKSYDMDLQIPSVTTSGDVSIKINKRPTTPHDKVSSSRKEQIHKNISKSNKSVVKKTKKKSRYVKVPLNLNDRKSSKMDVKRNAIIKDVIHEVKNKEKLKFDEQNSTETDEEFVDFKELLRARKLKKQRKLEEMKEKEIQLKPPKKEHSDKGMKSIEVSSSISKEKQPLSLDHIPAKDQNTTNIEKDTLQSEDDINLLSHGSLNSKLNKGEFIEKDDKCTEQLGSKTEAGNEEDKKKEIKLIPKKILRKSVSFSEDLPTSTSSAITTSVQCVDKKTIYSSEASSEVKVENNAVTKPLQNQIIVPSVSELIEENGPVGKRKISYLDYVKRRKKEINYRSSSTEEKSPDKKLRRDSNTSNDEFSIYLETGYKTTNSKTLSDLKTSFVIHSSDWEDSQSPKREYKQSSEECLIREFSGLIKTNSKKSVIDVNEFISQDSSIDVKLKEYKEKVHSKLNSLNIQIPKFKTQTLEKNTENKHKLTVDPYESPDTSNLIKRFLNNEKMSLSEMDKVKRIISYKRYIQQQKKDKLSISPTSNTTVSSNLLDDNHTTSIQNSYEIKNSSNGDLSEMKLHIKKVCSKRKLDVDGDSEKSEVSAENSEDYSVYNRLGKDGLPKMIFKRNRHSNVSDENDEFQPIVKLERLDLNRVKELYNITVSNICDLGTK